MVDAGHRFLPFDDKLDAFFEMLMCAHEECKQMSQRILYTTYAFSFGPSLVRQVVK
jgi:hypothetical protein